MTSGRAVTDDCSIRKLAAGTVIAALRCCAATQLDEGLGSLAIVLYDSSVSTRTRAALIAIVAATAALVTALWPLTGDAYGGDFQCGPALTASKFAVCAEAASWHLIAAVLIAAVGAAVVILVLSRRDS